MKSGSIRFSIDNIKFLHSLCFYDSCTNNDSGGAIYFKCNSSIVQHRFCTTNTYTTKNNGFHCFTNLISGSNLNNLIVESTICNCIQQSLSNTVDLCYGNIGIYSSNISKNNASDTSGACIVSANGLGIINYSTFTENYAKEFWCTNHRYTTYKDYMCNYIGNSQSSSTYGCVYIVSGTLTVENCTVLGEYKSGSAFLSNNAQLYVVNCNIDKLSSFSNSNGGTYSTSNIRITNSLNVLSHLSTYECEAVLTISDVVQNRPSFAFVTLYISVCRLFGVMCFISK